MVVPGTTIDATVASAATLRFFNFSRTDFVTGVSVTVEVLAAVACFFFFVF